MPSPPQSKLKARLLHAAVQENADAIAGRLPAPLRRSRRMLAWCRRSAWLLGLPLAVLAASADWAGPPSAPASASAPSATVDASTHGSANSLLTRPVAAGVLALGVQRVVIDAGHGGVDTGASSPGGLLEKDVALDVAKRLEQLLRARGVGALLTRTGDRTLSLKERATAANTGRGDIFVSIHVNALAPASTLGVETYYLGPGEHSEHDAVAAAENQHSGYSLADMRALLDRIYADARRDESRRLAASVQGVLVRRLQAVDPAIADRGVKTAPFIVLVATDMPAILAEVSCLTHAAEAERLGTATHRDIIAEALASGIQAFIGQRHTYGGERTKASES